MPDPNPQTWAYVAAIAVAALLLSVLAYLFGGRKVKIPAVITSGVAGVAVGLATGVIWLVGFADPPAAGGDAGDAGAAGMAKGGAPKMGGPPGGGVKGGGGGPGGA